MERPSDVDRPLRGGLWARRPGGLGRGGTVAGGLGGQGVVVDMAAQAKQAFEGDAASLVSMVLAAECGDQTAWSVLMREIRGLCASALLRGTGRVDPSMLDDLTQSTAEQLLRLFRAGRFDRGRAGRIRGLIAVVASRTMARAMHRRTAERAGMERYAGEPMMARVDEAATVADEVFRDTSFDRLSFERAVAGLPEPERTAVSLHALGCSFERIAEQIGRSGRSGAHKVVKRGLLKVLSALEPQGVRSRQPGPGEPGVGRGTERGS